MKKRLLFLAASLLAVLPFGVFAQEYKLKDTDMTITLDDSLWYVFTRDNLENNPELNELEVSGNELATNMNDNSIYMDAILFYEDGKYIELFVRKAKTDGANNLTNYKTKDVENLAKELAKKQSTDNYTTYENNYKYAVLRYPDQGFSLIEYFTVVNGYAYTFTAQTEDSYTDEEDKMIKEIIDTIHFDIDESLKDNTSRWYSDIWIYAIAGGAAGGIAGFISEKIKKKNEAKKN